MRAMIAPAHKAPAGYRMVAKAAKSAEIWLYGDIGQDWFGDGVSAKTFADDLRALGDVDTIDLRINSYGGVVTDARAMYTLLVEHKARVNTHIDGIAASAASVVALAGNDITIADGGFFMIHNPRGGVFGTAPEMRQQAGVLDLMTGTIRDTYAARSKQSDAQIQAWMDAETWFTGADTVAHGFADRVVENMRVAASASVNVAKRFVKLPAALLKPDLAEARALINSRIR